MLETANKIKETENVGDSDEHFRFTSTICQIATESRQIENKITECSICISEKNRCTLQAKGEQ